MSTASQSFAIPRSGTSLLRDYAELMKIRITVMVMITSWAGYYFGAGRAGTTALSWKLVYALLGIGLLSAGASALNEVLERDIDALMRRTARRPLVQGRMSSAHGLMAGIGATLLGAALLELLVNPLTGALGLATSVIYLGAYTPMKRLTPWCTFVGAFPGAMPTVLGWTAARGSLDWEALLLFAILFFWQFPHFYAIAWLYREDYERAGVRMLPVVEPDGRSTARSVLLYTFALVAATIAPALVGMTGGIYLGGAIFLGGLYFFAGWRLWSAGLSPTTASSKKLARHVLLASVIYLPLLFAIMVANATGTH